MRAFEESLLGAETFTVQGHCVVCARDVAFRVDHDNCWTGEDGRRVPNWRERLECPHCLLNNRMRASVGFLLAASRPTDGIYLTEAITPLFRALTARRPNTIGSEYLRDGTLPGTTNPAGIRHEDVTALTFPDRSLDVIGSFDVLEHVPDYPAALSELRRCLRPGGRLFLTVPLSLWSPGTVTRATVDARGAITHLTTPEYHGDPLDPNGALCFHNYGWDFLQALTDAGFTDMCAHLFWCPELGYLGGYQMIMTNSSRTLDAPGDRRGPEGVKSWSLAVLSSVFSPRT